MARQVRSPQMSGGDGVALDGSDTDAEGSSGRGGQKVLDAPVDDGAPSNGAARGLRRERTPRRERTRRREGTAGSEGTGRREGTGRQRRETARLARLQRREESRRRRSSASEKGPGLSPDARRFGAFAIVGSLVVSVPYLWILWDLWGASPNPLRSNAPGNFYDLQARAMFHGHFWVAKGTMGIEAFVHDGHYFTYFGIFPSLIRMPILLLTSSLDGQLTNLSLLGSWIFTGIFSALLIWRIRVMVRGDARLGRAEAGALGLLMATILGGSVLIFLASTPYVYNEDLAWSVALTIGSMFALLGVLERPSRGRVLLSGVLVLCAALDRIPTGLGCVVAAVLVALWLGWGKAGVENRRWFGPMLAVGLVPFALACAVNMAKFGVPVGLPMQDQVWTHVNEHRRYFLAVNGGRYYGPQFFPSTFWAYLGPTGLRFTSSFPFVTLPAAPSAAFGGVVFDRLYRTASLPASSPLLFIVACWGAVVAFLPKRPGRTNLIRIPLIGTAIAAGYILVWGYIATRYLADLMPFVIVAGIFGMIDIWRRVDGWRPRRKGVLLGAVTLLAGFSIFASVGISISPSEQFNQTQLVHFVATQESFSRLTGASLSDDVMRGNKLPYWAPAGKFFVVGNCSALYLSNGDSFKTVPKQQYEHMVWMPVERASGIVYHVMLTFNVPSVEIGRPVPVVSVGSSTLYVESAGSNKFRFVLGDKMWPVTGRAMPMRVGKTYPVTVIVDPNLRSMSVSILHRQDLANPFSGKGPVIIHDTSSQAFGGPAVGISGSRVLFQTMPLCRDLIGS